MNEKQTALLSEQAEIDRLNGKLEQLVDVDRRTLGKKHTVSYIVFDCGKDLNLNTHKDLFNEGVLNIKFSYLARYNFFAGLWDIVDDFLVGGMIEKTRTRFGKFVPWFFVSGFPFSAVSALYWLLPLFLTAAQIADEANLAKFFVYAALDMTLEFISNIRSVSAEGYLSTITPYPSDRRRLVALAGYCNGIFSRIPDLITEFAMDFIKNGIVKTGKSSDQSIRAVLMIIGISSSVLSGLLFTWYGTVAKERVHQKIERPRIRDSLRVVLSHRPIRVFMISNALGSFGTGMTTNDYYRQVLNWTTMETFAGIPSFFFQPIGFAKYNQLAQKFSTRTLYMVGLSFAKCFYIPLFFYGIFLKDKKGVPFFKNRWAMLPVTAVWEIIYATLWGVRSISITEMRNECNDYLEWKCGFRNEGTLSAAGAFITKIPARINGVLQPKYKEWVGYDKTAYLEGREQPEKAQKWIFAMATLIPAILVATSVLPMLAFNIDKNTRDRMYRELNERRAAQAEKIKREADEADLRG